MKRIIVVCIYDAYFEGDDVETQSIASLQDAISEGFSRDVITVGGVDFEKNDVLVAEKSVLVVADKIHVVMKC
jgi:hypothetical protein